MVRSGLLPTPIQTGWHSSVRERSEPALISCTIDTNWVRIVTWVISIRALSTCHEIASFRGCSSMSAISKLKPAPPRERSFATSGTQLILNGWTLNQVRSFTRISRSDSVSDFKVQRQVQDSALSKPTCRTSQFPHEAIIGSFHSSGVDVRTIGGSSESFSHSR